MGFLRQLSGVEAHAELSPTILAAAGESGNNKPCVAYSFDSLASNSMKSKNPHSGCRAVEVAKTLDTTDPSPNKNQGGIAIVEPIAVATQQGGAEITTNGVCPTITAAAGMSGNNQPWIVKTDGIIDNHILDDQGGQQIAVRTDGKAPTLRAETHGNLPCVMQAAGFKPSQGAKAMGIGWEEEISPTLLAGQEPAACIRVYDARGNGDGETVPTLTGDHENRVTDYTAVACYATDVGFFNTLEDRSPTLLARMYKDPHLVTYPEGAVQYIVRRLTPTECARLQGFPDKWGHPDKKDSFTEDEYKFWLNVRNTHAEINGKAVKEYTPEQMLKWYKGLHTDSAEYKMWGNGIALPPALYVLQGMYEALAKEELL